MSKKKDLRKKDIEKQLDECEAIITLMQYVPGFRHDMTKSESPDWLSDANDSDGKYVLGLEVSNALSRSETDYYNKTKKISRMSDVIGFQTDQPGILYFMKIVDEEVCFFEYHPKEGLVYTTDVGLIQDMESNPPWKYIELNDNKRDLLSDFILVARRAIHIPDGSNDTSHSHCRFDVPHYDDIVNTLEKKLEKLKDYTECKVYCLALLYHGIHFDCNKGLDNLMSRMMAIQNGHDKIYEIIYIVNMTEVVEMNMNNGSLKRYPIFKDYFLRTKLFKVLMGKNYDSWTSLNAECLIKEYQDVDITTTSSYVTRMDDLFQISKNVLIPDDKGDVELKGIKEMIEEKKRNRK